MRFRLACASVGLLLMIPPLVAQEHVDEAMVARIRVAKDALKQSAVVMASVLYHAAMRDGKIPR